MFRVCVFFCFCVYFVKLLQKANRIYFFRFFICLCEQSSHKLWYTKKTSSKVNWRTPRICYRYQTVCYCCFVLVLVCVIVVYFFTVLVVVLSAGWCPVARVGLVEGVFGKEVGIILERETEQKRRKHGRLVHLTIIGF